MPTLSRSRARILMVSIGLAVSGCATQHSTYAPDGRRGFVITCDGLFNNYATCLVKAGRACGNNGYDTLRGGEDDRNLLIACKVPAK